MGQENPEREIAETTAMAAEEVARPLSRGLPLVFVIASRAAQTIDATGTRQIRVNEWSFLYSAGSDGDAVAVAVDSSGAEVREGDTDRWKFWAKSSPIRDWHIDSDGAQEIGLLSGGELLPPGGLSGSPPIFSMCMGNVDGNSVPIWSLPYRFPTDRRYVCADTGQVALLSKATPDHFHKESNDNKAKEAGDASPVSEDFDVFVSYRRKDRRWVENTLLPKLRSWGVTYGIDFANFDDAVPFETEMNRLIQKSGQTLVVLTRNWSLSPFTAFEADASSGRIIVLRLDDCPLPLLPGGSQVIDLSRMDVEREWNGLKSAIQKSEQAIQEVEPVSSALQPLYATVAFSRVEPSFAGSQRLPPAQYVVTIEVENQAETKYLFDSLVLRIISPVTKQGREWLNDTIRVILTEDRAVIEYGRFNRYQGEGGTVARLAPGQGMRIPEIPLGPIAATVAGQQVAELAVSLALADLPITESCLCAMPPLNRLSGTDRPAITVPCLPTSKLPTSSRIIESGMRGQVFHAARSFAKDALLHMVRPHRVTVTGTNHRYAALYSADTWHCTFSSESKDCTFRISLDDPGWISKEGITSGHLRAKNWLSEMHLEGCRIDSRVAHLIGLQSGCRPPAWLLNQHKTADGQRALEQLALVLEEVQGRWRCLWRLPFGLAEDECMAITAETGEVCCFRDGSWHMLGESIWNLYSTPKE